MLGQVVIGDETRSARTEELSHCQDMGSRVRSGVRQSAAEPERPREGAIRDTGGAGKQGVHHAYHQ